MPTTSNTKQAIDEFLQRLIAGIEVQHIKSEEHIVERFRIWPQAQLEYWEGENGAKKPPTLLQLLGYSISNVDEHPVKKTTIGRMTYVPDYILMCDQKMMVVVDLKAPRVNIDHPDWFGQISTYCKELKVPLGLIFNGTEIRVFINTDSIRLTENKILFSNQYVAFASSHDRKQMVEVLLKFSVDSLAASPINVANGFATKRRRELNDRKRKEEIRQQLKALLEEPPDSAFAALSGVDEIWGEIEPRPSSDEVKSAWEYLKTASTANKQMRKK